MENEKITNEHLVEHLQGCIDMINNKNYDSENYMRILSFYLQSRNERFSEFSEEALSRYLYLGWYIDTNLNNEKK